MKLRDNSKFTTILSCEIHLGTNLDMLQEKKDNPCVQFRKLTEVATIVRGITYPKTAEIHNNSGFPVLRANNIDLDNNKLNFNDVVYLDKNFPVQNRHKLQKGDILISIASGSAKHIGKVAYIESDIDYYFGGFLAVVRSSPQVLSRFLFFCLTSSSFSKYLTEKLNTSTINNLSSSILSSFSIPCPSSDIQLEIVRILDRFTLLKAELEAELEARLAQYRYYRDALLDFSPVVSATRPAILNSLILNHCPQGVRYKNLGELATEIYRGSGIKRDQVSTIGTPCVRYGEIYTTYGKFFNNCVSHTKETEIQNKKYFSYGDILFAITGENVDEISKSTVYIGEDRCLAGGDIVVMKHAQNPKYMAYVLSTTDAQRQKSLGKVKSKVVHSSVPEIKKIRVPIPPLPVQEAIVEILDRFETLVHDMREGLPAEIALRQKQYEYYRDKLLSF